MKLSRRTFTTRMTAASLAAACGFKPHAAGNNPSAESVRSPILRFPGPWAFNAPKGHIILVSDQQLEDLQNPDKEVNLSLGSTPRMQSLRSLCEQQKAAGAKTIILAFDHFFAQYRPGAAKRKLLPDTDEYIERVARMGKTLRDYGLGFELSLLSPLELGAGYRSKTGLSGRWLQYREGLRDPSTGRYEVQLWEHQRWTNNKGSIDVKRTGTRVFAFSERRIGNSSHYAVNPSEIVELAPPEQTVRWEGMTGNAGESFASSRLTISGRGDPSAGNRNRVLVVVSYETPEMDYFSDQSPAFLAGLVDRYHQAGVPLNGLYADEMHIQQDWAYHSHHDEGQFTLRYCTPAMSRSFAKQYGPEFADLEKYMVYFCYGQHGFLPGLEARLPSCHVLGSTPEDIHRTILFRRRYYELLSRRVVGLFADAKQHAEKLYGHELESRAHATWAQSPTIDRWESGSRPHPQRQYEYTSNFLWANSVHQAASACDDYFKWNDFLTGGGNDHTEGGWLDRNYFALALACSTGVLNRTPYAYAAHWGMPSAVSERRQALVDAYGASASPPFQAVQESQHRETEVLMLYPMSLVAAEERFGSWMVQYGYANYITSEVLASRGRVTSKGWLEVNGRRYQTVVALFEIVPAPGLLQLLEEFVAGGGRVLWSGPPPRFDLAGKPVFEIWRKLFGIQTLLFQHEGWMAPGETIRFANPSIPSQTVLTHLIVDHVYPVTPAGNAESVASLGENTVGTLLRNNAGGTAVFLGFRPRDDQSASLGIEVRTWFELLRSMGAYGAGSDSDNPAVVSRTTDWLACSFPNGAVALAPHFRSYTENWPGGFQRNEEQDAKILSQNPLPSDRLSLRDLKVKGFKVQYEGRLAVCFRLGNNNRLQAFAGQAADSIVLNGTRHQFADRPLPFIAWAPVSPERRLPGGAVLEFWVQGEGEVQIPMPEGFTGLRGVNASHQWGHAGSPFPTTLRNGSLIFEAASPTGRLHGYLLPA